jgi:hypothetical protein
MQLMASNIKTAIRRQIPFLIGGTITGAIMAYYIGFLPTILVNSTMWFIISLITYKLVWKSSGLADQKYLLRYFLARINFKGRQTNLVK